MSGTYANSSPTFGTLIYKDDGAGSNPVALMPGSTATSSFSFVHQGIATPGSHTVAVRDSSGAVTVSNTFQVVAAKIVSPTAINGAVAGVSFTFAGTLAGYTVAPTLTYRLDGGSALPVTGVTSTTWSMNLTGPAAGNHTILVSDNSAPPVTGSVSFTVSAPGKVITVTSPSGVVAGGTFPFMGTLSNYTAAPALTYSFDGGVTKLTLPGVTSTGWSATIPSPATSGNYTVLVSDGTVTGSAQFTVAAAPHVITVSPIATATAGTTIPFTGTLGGYTAVPTLTYRVDGGTATAVTGVTVTGWSMNLTAPAAGSHTVAVTDGTVTSPTVNFTTTAVVKQITPAQPSGTVQNVAFTFTGTLIGYGSTPSLTYSLDGGAPVTMTGVTPSTWSMSVTITTVGSHTIVVTDGTFTGSTSFTTAAATIKTITPAALSGTTQDVAFTFAGTLSGYSSPPTLTYSLNSGPPVTMTGVSSTSWSMTTAVGSSGSNTIVVIDGLGNSGSVSFTTAAATRTLIPTPPVLPAAGSTITFTGNFKGYAAAPILKYQIDSQPAVTMTGVTEAGGATGGVSFPALGFDGSDGGIPAAAGVPYPAVLQYSNYLSDWNAWKSFGLFNTTSLTSFQVSPFPLHVNGGVGINFNATDLANNHQADFDALAQAFHAAGEQHFLSANLGWEWNSGGVCSRVSTLNGQDWDTAGLQSLYIQFWRNLAKSFQTYAPNIIRAWCANTTLMASGGQLSDWYPGDDVVDAIGLDMYGTYVNEGATNDAPSTTELNNGYGWMYNMSAATFLGPNHPAKATGSMSVNGVSTPIPFGGKKYIVIAEWQNSTDFADYVTRFFNWVTQCNGRVLCALYWNSYVANPTGTLINSGESYGQQMVAATAGKTYPAPYPIPRFSSSGAGTGGTWSMSIPAPAVGSHTITVTDAANSVTSGPIPFTVASATAIPVIDARFQNPSQKFTDAQGVVWDISLTAQCRANSAIDAITSSVDFMALLPGGNIWQKGTGAWYTETQNNDSWVPGNNPLPANLAVRCADVLSTFGYQINIDQGTGFSNPTIIAASFAYLNSTLCRQQAKATHSANLAGFAGAAPAMRFMLTPMLANSSDFNGSGSGGPANNVVTNLNQALTDIGGASRVFSVEGQNEANANQPSGTAASYQTGNTGMANAVRSISALANVPILNLTLNNSSETAAEAIYTSMGNQTGIGVSWCNWHGFPQDGTGGGAPFTNSTGLTRVVNNQAVVAPGRPPNWTSTGYDMTGNAANGSHVTGAAGGKMLCSGFMSAYAAELASVVVFSMFNDAGTGYGLFDTSGNPNTMATYVHNFTTPLLDTAPTARTFVPIPLNYTLAFSGTGTQASSMLMQAADGSFRLVLWNNDAVQTTGASPTDVTPSANNVTITLSVACTSGAIYDPAAGATPAATFGVVTTIGPVAIQGYPKIVKIVP